MLLSRFKWIFSEALNVSRFKFNRLEVEQKEQNPAAILARAEALSKILSQVNEVSDGGAKTLISNSFFVFPDKPSSS